MINDLPDDIYRYCVDEEKGNCKYMVYNSYGIPCCSIDKVVQVYYFGCIPQDILNKKEKTNED